MPDKNYYQQHKEKYKEAANRYYQKIKNDPEFKRKTKERSQKYYKKNKELINKKCKKYYDKVRKKRRYSEEIRNNYGITIEQYNKIFESQGGVCLICGNVETRTRNGKPTRLAIDHCHVSGKIRGLLCSACNSRLGWYEIWKNQIESYLKNN